MSWRRGWRGRGGIRRGLGPISRVLVSVLEGEREEKNTYSPLHTHHPAPPNHLPVLLHSAHRVPGIVVAYPEAVEDFGVGFGVGAGGIHVLVVFVVVVLIALGGRVGR